MKPRERYPYYVNLFLQRMQIFVSVLAGTFVFFLLGRFLEYFLFNAWQAKVQDFSKLLSIGVLHDTQFFFQWAIILLPPYVLISWFFETKTLTFIVSLFAGIFLVLYYALVLYFCNTGIPLGYDVFGYGLEEGILIIGAAGYLNFWLLLGILAFLSVFYLFCLQLRKIDWPYWVLLGFMFASWGFWEFATDLKPTPALYGSERKYHIVSNKMDFMVSEVQAKKTEKQAVYFEQFYYDDEFSESKNRYISGEFPLLVNDVNPDVLSAFFKPLKRKPNIVIIIVESLGRSYSGPDARLGSFTPYLDSLANKSLYWQNFLSNGGRTFAVLPSLLASLPNNGNSFMERKSAMPNFIGLTSILQNNGYATRFFHGGEAKFDQMDYFLRRAGVKQIVERKTFSKKYKLMPSSKEGFTWGYGDKELFEHYFDYRQAENLPTLDVILTLSMHSPFLVHGQQRYDQQFQEIVNKYPATKKQSYLPYKSQYSTILYFDDALRAFMEKYKSMPSYENTIFIITGDHRMPEIPMENSLTRFQVPFVIFSPLLERTKKMSGINSHVDLTPSLLAFLMKENQIEAPQQTAWVGSSFDTSATFSAKKFIPLMRNKKELVDFVYGDVFCANNWYQEMDEQMNTFDDQNPKIQSLAAARFFDYTRKTKVILDQNRLIPDSTFRRFGAKSTTSR